VDVAVSVAFQVLLVNLRVERDWSDRIHERFTAIRRRSHDALQGPALFEAEDEAVPGAPWPLLQSVKHLPNPTP